MDSIRRTQKSVEKGKGRILRNGNPFAECDYHLLVEQELHVSETLTNSIKIPGQFIYSGEVAIEQKDLLQPGVLEGMQSGQIFILQLEDGKTLKVFFNPVPGDPLSGRYKIIVAPQ
jgi:hypothetical protein